MSLRAPKVFQHQYGYMSSTNSNDMSRHTKLLKDLLVTTQHFMDQKSFLSQQKSLQSLQNGGEPPNWKRAMLKLGHLQMLPAHLQMDPPRISISSSLELRMAGVTPLLWPNSPSLGSCSCITMNITRVNYFWRDEGTISKLHWLSNLKTHSSENLNEIQCFPIKSSLDVEVEGMLLPGVEIFILKKESRSHAGLQTALRIAKKCHDDSAILAAKYATGWHDSFQILNQNFTTSERN